MAGGIKSDPGAVNLLFVMSIALGGCIKGPPVQFGLTEDTGGHITYALGAGMALAARADVDRVELVTRLIDDPDLGAAYSVPVEIVSEGFTIRRLATGDRRYLAKEANQADRAAFTTAILAYIDGLPRKPDVVHAHFADAAGVAIAIRDRFDIPFVFTAHSLGIDKAGCGDTMVPSARIVDEDRAISLADAIVASSRDEAERQLMLYPGACAAKIHCIAPGATLPMAPAIDLDRARALIARFLHDPTKPIILAIARPVAKKNLAGLIDLYAANAWLRTTANLVIVAGLRHGPDSGEAEQNEVIGDLLSRMDRHDLYGSLALPKRHDQDDIAALYALARDTGGVFVNPAFTEPYGLTITEAAVHGVPVVATCHGGPADIVGRLGHGLTADPRDATSFAAAIQTMLTDRPAWDRASRAGMDNARAYDWHGYAEKFVGITRRMIEPAPLPAPADRLLLCDIDNTLTGCSDGARAMATYLAQQPDLAFGVATGRSLQEAIRLLDEWHQPDPRVLITSVGSEIYWRRDGVLHLDRDYAASIDTGWDPAMVERHLSDIIGIDIQPPVEQRRFKRSWFVRDPSAVAAVRARLSSLPVRVVYSHGHLLDVLPIRAGKGAAMAWVARQLEIPQSHVYAAGDSGNDFDMLDACRNGILVANHSDDLGALVGRPTIYVARRAHAGGVVEAMRAYARRIAA